MVLVFGVVVCTQALGRTLIGARVAALAWLGVIVTDLLLTSVLQG